MEHPFFKSRDRFLQMGPQRYLEDLNRTYKKLPARDNAAFERARQFREKEKAQVHALAEENELLRSQLGDYTTRAADVMRRQMAHIKELNSKLEADARERSGADSSRTGRENDDEPRIEECSTGRDDDVSGEVLRADVPDSSGLAAEHADEGRPTEGTDDSGGVQAE